MKTNTEKRIEKNIDEALSTIEEMKKSFDRLIELLENPPEGEPPEWGDVL